MGINHTRATLKGATMNWLTATEEEVEGRCAEIEGLKNIHKHPNGRTYTVVHDANGESWFDGLPHYTRSLDAIAPVERLVIEKLGELLWFWALEYTATDLNEQFSFQPLAFGPNDVCKRRYAAQVAQADALTRARACCLAMEGK